jgi:uncharacterized protein YybS (DUF2232 family)
MVSADMTHTSLSVELPERGQPRVGATLGAGLLSALLFAPLVVAPELAFVAVACPVPLAVHRLRGGLVNGLVATLLAAGVIGLALRPGTALAFVVAFAIPGLLIAEGLARGRGLLRGCAWAFGLLTLLVATLLLADAGRMSNLLLERLDETIAPQQLELLRKGGLSSEQIDERVDQIKRLRSAVAVVFPALYFVGAGLLVLANATLLRTYLARRDPGWLEGGEFEEIRWPLALAVVFLVAGAAVALPATRSVAYNALLVLAFFFAVQGLAVATFFAHRLAGPPLLRLMVMFLVLMNPWAPQLLALLGLFDIYLDFRQWARPSAA